MGTTLTPTLAQPQASPAPPSGEKRIFSLLWRVEEGAAGVDISIVWRVKSLLFYAREIFLWQRNIAHRDREDGQRAKVNEISFMPENIVNKAFACTIPIFSVKNKDRSLMIS